MNTPACLFLITVFCLSVALPTENSKHNTKLTDYIRSNNFIEDRQYIHHVDFLEKFGFLEKGLRDAHNESCISTAILDMQHLYNLPLTGIADKLTAAAMRMPRCGQSDHHHSKRMRIFKNHRGKRYSLEGSRWHKRRVTYKISGYSRKIDYLKTNALVREAFGMWSEVIPLDFVDLGYFHRGPVDIEIFWATGWHGDNFPFHGPGGVLAHCFYPKDGGDAHFDDAEHWVLGEGPYGTINLIQVMTHEFGHGIGLLHSNNRHSIMQPFYAGYNRYFKLGSDDIYAAQAIYGKR